MRKIILILYLTIIHLTSIGQNNLVPNPSFEIAVSCPTVLSMLSVANWTSFCNSPDYFNSCSMPSTCGVPNNGFGHQVAATGSAYCGFLNIWPGVGGREYLGAKLTQTLVIGKRYYLSMKVNLAERWFSNVNAPLYIPSNNCGMKFSTNVFSVQSPISPNNQAALYSSTIINDTTNWVTLTGAFIADSSYQYVILGNFFKDNQTDTIARPQGFDSYFFVDDVIVTTDSTMILIGISEHESSLQSKAEISISALGARIKSNSNIAKELLIYDANGVLLHREIFIEEEKQYNLNLKSGMYFVVLKSSEGILAKKKFLIEGLD
jgi:hypothetical protein